MSNLLPLTRKKAMKYGYYGENMLWLRKQLQAHDGFMNWSENPLEVK